MGRCPTCHKPAAVDFRPFCSKRCQEVDLGRWLDGHYRFASQRLEDGAELDAALRETEAESREKRG